LTNQITHRAKVLAVPDSCAVEADRSSERGEVDVRKLDQVEWMTLRPEVVDLGPVGGIVVHDDQHRQTGHQRQTESSVGAPQSRAEFSAWSKGVHAKIGL
jgi:hypothetical protein